MALAAVVGAQGIFIVRKQMEEVSLHVQLNFLLIQCLALVCGGAAHIRG